ncbi:hypothetical protein FDP48_12185 [Enterococcus faecalis]|nr:hypothetical protein [Enterococcus faecalis]
MNGLSNDLLGIIWILFFSFLFVQFIIPSPKYDYAFKKKVIKAYQNGAGGYRTLGKQFNISSCSTVHK